MREPALPSPCPFPQHPLQLRSPARICNGHTQPAPPTTTSLDILDPEPWVPVDSRPPDGATERRLEHLSRALCDIFATADFDNPLLAHVSASFQAYVDHGSRTVHSLADHIAFHRSMSERFPQYVWEVGAVSAHVDEAKGLASVWTTLRVTGHPLKIQRESVTVFSWRRTRGVWSVYKQFGIRGVRWFDDVV